MSLVEQLSQRLDRPGIDGANIVVRDVGDQLLVRVDQAGPLAATVWELRLTTDRLAGASIERVREIAEEITCRVTYLLEPIQPIESDSEACVVQLRSTKPDEQQGVKSYYEALVKTGGTISLQRYESQPGSIRSAIAMTLTKEIICRLADDFLESVG